MQSFMVYINHYEWGAYGRLIYNMNLDSLIQGAKDKDSAAFDTIYRTYYPKMVKVCMSIVRDDRTIVDDLVHDAFIMAFVSIGNLRDNSKFSEWLTTIVRNVSLKYVKQRNNISILPMSTLEEENVVVADVSSSPESVLNHKELLELINLLPEGYRKVLQLSVIEGFSHKEIAEMLGIEPHSSSSQLSRAKRLLRRMMNGRVIGFVALLLLPIAWYVMFRHDKDQHTEDAVADTKRSEQMTTEPNDSVDECLDSVEDKMEMVTPARTVKKSVEIAQTDNADLTPEVDTIVVPRLDVNSDELVADDTSEDDEKDTLPSMNIQIQEDVAEEFDNQRKKWHLLAAGSLGAALAQNVYKLVAVDYSGMPEPDDATTIPTHVSTWEEYYRYLNLKSFSSPYVSSDTLVLIDIAKNNSGEIKQSEHHDKPITFGVSLTKSFDAKWSVETGLQYSLLNSQFSMGEDGYSVVDDQKVHYLGIPLRLSYNWVDVENLSVYTSFGVTMHVPVYGKVKTNYYVDGQSQYTQNEHFTPPLQWQTGASLGLQYEFAPNASIFVEPTYNWFIPLESETHTIWTEHPWMFTCPFGVRITW